ncbi:TMEM175 family protein [Actinomadura rupiterrae]|uniref:TMEM175 family protein n=1 Tax=Actinomadura rupiterrae TaxID=559627 RepID=UPI0020A3BE24|nr:TMEM175 family protein [Actinomadura rupiterrae]MCP2335994.1 putative membrane protein [Actinomadura rupiterrae]
MSEPLTSPPEQADAELAISPARLQAFSDGVIAIAATLLILDVHRPGRDEPVWSALRHEWPALDSYAVTFLVIGIAWIHHHNLFHRVVRVDRTLLFLNLGLLATISFLPLPTATLGEHLTRPHAADAAVFYAVSMAVSSGWFTLFWHHLARHPELMHEAARGTAARARRQSLLGPVGYLVAALVALASPIGALMLSSLIVLYFVVGRRNPASRTRIPGTAPVSAPAEPE